MGNPFFPLTECNGPGVVDGLQWPIPVLDAVTPFIVLSAQEEGCSLRLCTENLGDASYA